MFVMQIGEVGRFILCQNFPTSLTLQLVYCSLVSAIAIGLSLSVYKALSLSPHLRLLLFGER